MPQNLYLLHQLERNILSHSHAFIIQVSRCRCCSNVKSTTVVDALSQIFKRMGFLKEIIAWSSNFVYECFNFRIFRQLWNKNSYNSVYHSQSNPGERFRRTVKRIFPLLCQKASYWEQHVYAILFVLRTGFPAWHTLKNSCFSSPWGIK